MISSIKVNYSTVLYTNRQVEDTFQHVHRMKQTLNWMDQEFDVIDGKENLQIFIQTHKYYMVL